MLDWDAWATCGPIPRPAPRPFPAAPFGDALRAVDDLVAEVAAIRDRLAVLAKPPEILAPETARAVADDLDCLAEAATETARAIHDAMPDQVCGNCLGRRFVDGPGELFAVNCPTCNPPAPGAAPAFRQDNDAGPAEARNRWA